MKRLRQSVEDEIVTDATGHRLVVRPPGPAQLPADLPDFVGREARALLDRLKIDGSPEDRAELIRLCAHLPLAPRIAGAHLADRLLLEAQALLVLAEATGDVGAAWEALELAKAREQGAVVARAEAFLAQPPANGGSTSS